MSKYIIEHGDGSRIILKGWNNGAAMDITILECHDDSLDEQAVICLTREELDIIHDILENFLNQPTDVVGGRAGRYWQGRYWEDHV